jgi:hypothetical protein
MIPERQIDVRVRKAAVMGHAPGGNLKLRMIVMTAATIQQHLASPRMFHAYG